MTTTEQAVVTMEELDRIIDDLRARLRRGELLTGPGVALDLGCACQTAEAYIRLAEDAFLRPVPMGAMLDERAMARLAVKRGRDRARVDGIAAGIPRTKAQSR